MIKKKLAFIAVIALIISMFGGVVYAAGGHQSARGDKLVGVGVLGTELFGSQIQNRDVQSTVFQITNADCKEKITIKQVSILDDQGNVIYEGPFLEVNGDVREIKSKLSPHEICSLRLSDYMYNGGDPLESVSWMTPEEALAQDLAAYTVEIRWDAKSRTVPLTGWQKTFRLTYELGERYRGISESQMVNVEQQHR